MVFINRNAQNHLVDWQQRKNRKPLIVRGARQVGKTMLVKHLGQSGFDSVVAIDLEMEDTFHSLFRAKNPATILEELSLLKKSPIIPGRTLLFLDEIQACPEALACLRYFYEQMPELHVIAAGSLLEFALRDHRHSMPVGRVENLYLNPLTFEEFLSATGNGEMRDYLGRFHLGDEIGDAVHAQFLDLQRKYFFVGGMPEAVATYVGDLPVLEVQRVQDSIVTTMQDDFAKYGTKSQQQRLRTIFRYVPRNIGKKIKFVNVDRDSRSGELKEALDMLEMSRVVHLIRHSPANGIPLDAEDVSKLFKPLFLDIGLCSHLCGLNLLGAEAVLTVNEGMLAEQFVGQELLCQEPPFQSRRLFYWHREQKNANAEIDYLTCHNHHVIPIEVKSGTSGSLKSLHVFLAVKGRTLGVRLNINKPSLESLRATMTLEDKPTPLAYTLLSLPLYLVGQLSRLIAEYFEHAG